MTWKTKDGHVLDIKEMTDAHLKNTIAMLRRNAARLHDESLASLAGSGGGEMAEYYALGESDALSEQACRAQMIANEMEQELKNRTVSPELYMRYVRPLMEKIEAGGFDDETI